MAEIESFDVRVYREGVFSRTSEQIIREVALEILLNEQKLVTVACCGNHVEEIALGFLRSEGLIANLADVQKMEVTDGGRVVSVWTERCGDTIHLHHVSEQIIASSSVRAWHQCGGGNQGHKISGIRLFISPEQVFKLMKDFVDASRLHAITGGTHSSALAHTDGIIVVREDIGRHNTIDMLGGYALLNAIICSDKIILRTGRVSSEIINKVRNLGVPIVISLSVPTSAAIRLSIESGITMIGSVRKEKMTVYSHDWRVRM